ncbi:FecR family protein [Agaribacterium haliotis]|uniref:FecR family protein n=1 Tax=Agaribacterium haliotis TaxID=2013869 RepID=UPI0011787664|nr:FecR domain-containing protein [Agaribacterium haliotis]
MNQQVIKQQARDWVLRINMNGLDEREQLEFNTWIHQNPKHQQAFSKTEETWKAIGYGDELERYIASTDFTSRQTPFVKYGLGLAAAACILMLISPFIFKHHNHSETFISNHHGNSEYYLKDGSRLRLSGDSQATMRWSKSSRELTLDKGSIYIEVEHNTQKPFIVHSHQHQIIVVGTAFEVQQSPSATQISVTEGRVKIEKPKAFLWSKKHTADTLEAGQQLKLHTDGNKGNIRPFDKNNKLAWLNDRLSYEHEKLEQIINDINRYSHKKYFIENNKIKNINLTLSFKTDQADAAIKGIAASQNLSLIHRSGQIVISHPR